MSAISYITLAFILGGVSAAPFLLRRARLIGNLWRRLTRPRLVVLLPLTWWALILSYLLPRSVLETVNATVADAQEEYVSATIARNFERADAIAVEARLKLLKPLWYSCFKVIFKYYMLIVQILRNLS